MATKPLPLNPYASVFGAAALRDGLERGDEQFLQWLRWRVRSQAAPRFSAWAWEWIEDDFFMDLVTQLNVTVLKPGFILRSDGAAYVDTAIRNLCKQYFTRIARQRSHTPLETTVSEVETQEQVNLDHVILALDLTNALAQLPREARQLLIGKYVYGYSLKDLGEMLSIPAQTVQSRLHSCRQKLRAIWFKEKKGPTR